MGTVKQWCLRVGRASLAGLVFVLLTVEAHAQKRYDAGASDTEIKIGNTMPYSGPASAYGAIGKALSAYFRMVNDNGGVNGRKITFISYDDAYSPPKTLEQVRKLVESDEVLLMFYPLGTASNAAVQKYLNTKKVPHLFVATAASRWSDPKNFPWTMGWGASYRSEARAYASYILEKHPGAKIGILYQNDDFGRDYLAGLKDVLGEQYTKMVVAEAGYEVSAPTIDSLIVSIRSAQPDIFINIATPKFAAQAIRKAAELDWRPVHIVSSVSSSIASVLRPAGVDVAKGLLSASYRKDSADQQWANDPTMLAYRSFVDKYFPEADKADEAPLTAFGVATGLTQVLKQAGDELTRENIMKQAASLDLEIGAYLPGIRIKTSAVDYSPIEQLQMMRFNGAQWERFGPLIDSHVEN